jgi:DNA-binding MarR family transcriptional regulator
MHDFNLDDFLPYRLAVTANRISKALGERYRRRFGLSIPEWRVLAHLSQAESVSVREIHERVELDKSKVSRAAARLVADGIIAKRINSTDKRLLELSLTDKGRAIMSELVPLARDYETEILTKLPAKDRANLDRLLRRLDEALK